MENHENGRFMTPDDCKMAHEPLMTEMRHARAILERIDKTLHGNGHPGMVVRVDRLEQREIRRDFIVKTCLVAAVGSLFSAAGTLLLLLVRLYVAASG